jgi:hypothetical protein
MKSIEQQLAEALEGNKTLAAQVAKLTESSAVLAKAAAQATLEQHIAEAKLPEPCNVSLRATFKEAVTVDGIKEAIAEKVALVKELTVIAKKNGTPENIQESATDASKAKSNLIESYQKNLGFTKEQAERAAA